MDVFVESNFILELAFLQGQHLACERVLAGAISGRYRLHVPQYALTEVFQTLRYRSNERAEQQSYFQREIEQHRRETDVDLVDTDNLVRLLNNLLTERTAAQTTRLYATTAQLARVALGPALTSEVLTEAQMVQARHGLSPQDALVYASVLAGLRLLPADSPKLFITRNPRDFEQPLIIEELRTLGCHLMSNFHGAAQRLEFGNTL
ncbi:PIN domain-containing protein [Hymenobacter rubidus]|uniref:PIN domain-containing protein n=1 Tax=Hymenobacter rubidus TaxID=1441626 RepID=UPI00191F3BDD|nr:PIN domain-containing protein [Hymenobacter rubidus]